MGRPTVGRGASYRGLVGRKCLFCKGKRGRPTVLPFFDTEQTHSVCACVCAYVRVCACVCAYVSIYFLKKGRIGRTRG